MCSTSSSERVARCRRDRERTGDAVRQHRRRDAAARELKEPAPIHVPHPHHQPDVRGRRPCAALLSAARGPIGSAKRGRHARSARRQRPHRSQNAHIKVTSTARPSRSGSDGANDPRRTPEEGGVRRGSGPSAVVVTDGEIISPVARRRMTRLCTRCQGVVNPVHERRLDADDRVWARNMRPE